MTEFEYRKVIIEIIGKMHNSQKLKKIYDFVLYLYLKEDA